MDSLVLSTIKYMVAATSLTVGTLRTAPSLNHSLTWKIAVSRAAGFEINVAKRRIALNAT